MTFTEQFIDYASESTDCPPMMLEWAAIMAISSTMGRRIYFDYGDGGLLGNLWVVLIGPSSMHKSTAINLASSIIKSVNHDIFYSQGWSKEALWKEISAYPTGIFKYDEAKSFFDCCSAQYNLGIMGDITTMFGGESLKRKTLKEEIEIVDPCIGFIGASTPEWLIEGIKDKSSAILSGFLPRFLLISAKPTGQHYSWYRPVDKMKKQLLIDKLKGFSSLSGAVRYNDEAAKAFERWDSEMHHKIISLEKNAVPYVPFLNKMSTLYPHKLAMIASMNVGTFPIINMEAWTLAMRWLSEAEQSVMGLLGSLVKSPWDKVRDKAIAYLSTHLDCTREQFGDATHITGRTADSILSGLENDGKIVVKKMIKTTKPITVIQWVGDSI